MCGECHYERERLVVYDKIEDLIGVGDNERNYDTRGSEEG